MAGKKIYSTSKSYQNYSRDVRETSIVSLKRENQIKKLILDPNVSESEKSKLKNELIEGHLRYVIQQAHKFVGLGIELEDLISSGNLGLVKAMNSFDFTRDIKFITHAKWLVMAELYNNIYTNSRLIRLPENVSKELHRQIKLQNEKNIDIDDEYASLPSTYDLYDKIGDDGMLIDIVKNSNADSPEDQLEQKLIMKRLTSKLDEKQMKVVNMLFGLDCEQLELKEVAEKMKMSKESVRTIKVKAIEIMKQ
jgi:RNA polymerase primary sigma factor